MSLIDSFMNLFTPAAAIQGAGIAAELYGGNVAAKGALQEGQAASQADIYNAAVASTNAKLAKQNAIWAGQAGEADVGISQAKTRAGAGTLLASQGASGVDLGSQSFTNVRASQAATGMLDSLTIRSNAAKAAYGYNTEAESDESQASLDSAKAGYDVSAANTRAKSTLLSADVAASKSSLSGPFGDYLSKSALSFA